MGPLNQLRALPCSDFQHHRTRSSRLGLTKNFSRECESLVLREEGLARFKRQLSLERGCIRRIHIGRVGDHQFQWVWDGCEQIALNEVDSRPQLPCIELGNVQCALADIRRSDLPIGFQRHADTQNAAAGANVAGLPQAQATAGVQRRIQYQLCLRPRDERVLGDFEAMPTEPLEADDVGPWFPFPAAAQPLAHLMPHLSGNSLLAP